MTTRRFDNLAAARGLAALIVFLSHIVQVCLLRFAGLGSILHRMSSYLSEYAVLVFFVISGFLIANSLEATAKKSGKLNLGVFAAARVARLYPPLIYAMIISVAVYAIMGVFHLPGRAVPLGLPDDMYAAREIVTIRFKDLIGALTMTQGLLEVNGPLWSLYIEAKLYVLFACAVGWFVAPYKLWLAIAFVLVAQGGVFYNPDFAAYSAIWMVGALAFYITSEHRQRKSRLAVCTLLLIACLVGFAFSSPDSVEKIGKLTIDLTFATFTAWLIFCRGLRLPFGEQIADFSYSLYITHFPVLLLAQSLLIATGSSSVFAAAFAGVLGGAAAFVVAYIGGLTEAWKSAIQNRLIQFGSGLRKRVLPHEPRAPQG